MPRRLLAAFFACSTSCFLLQCGDGVAFVTTSSSTLSPSATRRCARGRSASSRSRSWGTISLSASRRNTGRDTYNWEQDVLDRAVKDMLVDRAVETIRHLWNETGGDIYGQWLDRYTARQNLGDDVISTMGWARFLIKMMREDPVEAVVIRAVKVDSAQVVEAQRKNNARPPTLSPWRHSVNQLSADWDAEREEEMKVALDYPPRLTPVKKSVVVQPAELTKKLMDVREQLALEWRKDLENIERENEEIVRLDSERRRNPDYDEAVRSGGGSRRRLTYDHGQAFGGDSSPLRSDNYETLIGYLTEIGALAVQERMRVDGDEMGWNWMEQFLYWAKANSKYGSAAPGDDTLGSPPPLPSEVAAEDGSIGLESGARGKRVKAVFGAVGVGIYGADDDRKMRGNRMIEEMLMGQNVQTFDLKKKRLVSVDPAKIGHSVMDARVEVARRISASLETVPSDHGLVLRRYLEDKWEADLLAGLGGEGHEADEPEGEAE